MGFVLGQFLALLCEPIDECLPGLDDRVGIVFGGFLFEVGDVGGLFTFRRRVNALSVFTGLLCHKDHGTFCFQPVDRLLCLLYPPTYPRLSSQS
ncbi:hypothetical protein D3C75_615850 [compost metagenome]